ncbi:MAG TPA: VOC family protein [Baekduia sp.]|uniref:VOC family protein n=1 Tax=Baekduia sp. TaxID=2600305 RepID=UPI002C9FE334|nr:VOC family protein [Baekduia sp.]HMJ35697.1 VOC family protein [Baekduia sp.]
MTIHHVSLETRRGDLDAEVAFWALLGFAQVQPPGELGERSTWVQSGGTQIHLLHADEPVVAPDGHVAVVCPAFEETTEALREAGFAVEARTPYWGAPRAFTRSPGGHKVEVMAAPPGELPRV